jgi:polyhydroxyalkanoate synthesis regulator phasin
MTRFLEDIVDDTKNFVDDLIDRTKDAESNARNAVRDVTSDDGGADGDQREIERLQRSLDDLKKKVEQLSTPGSRS